MSMEHKAFVFDWEAFDKQLSGILYSALAAQDVTSLVAFIHTNLPLLKDPYEGEPLNEAWENLLEVKDVHEYGDFALTLFYDPAHNIGLGYGWQSLQDLLSRELHDGSRIILGSPFGPVDNYFDAGKMGTYFQSPDHVRQNLSLVKELTQRKPNLSETLMKVIEMFDQPGEMGKGLYVTF